MVEWLREILPGKTTAELYMAIGCQKHGKTECYREYLTFMAQSQEQFIIAPGGEGHGDAGVHLAVFRPGIQSDQGDEFAPQKR